MYTQTLLYNTTCLTPAFFKSGDECSNKMVTLDIDYKQRARQSRPY